MADRRLALLGMMGALIEATLYIFIFLWTPALEGTAGGVEAVRRPDPSRPLQPLHA